MTRNAPSHRAALFRRACVMTGTSLNAAVRRTSDIDLIVHDRPLALEIHQAFHNPPSQPAVVLLKSTGRVEIDACVSALPRPLEHRANESCAYAIALLAAMQNGRQDCSLEEPVDVGRRTAEELDEVCPTGHQKSAVRPRPHGADRRQSAAAVR